MVLSIPAWAKLTALHLLFLAAITVYLCHFFMAERAMVVTFALAAVAGEVVSAWKRVFIAEILLIAAAAAAYGVWHPQSREDWHAYLGMLMACWLLVPSRLAWLRWLVPLTALEMLYLGINVEDADLVLAASRTLVPLAVVALAADAWMVSTNGARSSVRNRPARFAMLRWALIPTVLALVIGLGGGAMITRSNKPLIKVTSEQTVKGKGGTPGLPTVPRIGDEGTISRDPSVAARINWEGRQPPAGMVYLRAMSLPVMRVEGDKIEWDGDSDEANVPVPRAAPAADQMAWVYRAAGGSDVILHPDGSDVVDLEGMLGDREGNLFRLNFAMSPHVYRTALDGPQRGVRTDIDNLYTFVSDRLTFPWDQTEVGGIWRYLKPEAAADAIAAWMVDHCHCVYSLDTPKPIHLPGGALRTFLFAEDPANRRGHCQYFATAEALLLRKSGHQSRLVVGFASNERDEQGVTFRGLHAHAWTEVVDSGGRWRRIDATPGGARNDAIAFQPGEEPPPPPSMSPDDPAWKDEVGEQRSALARGGWLAVALVVLVLAWFGRRWWRRRGLDPRRAELERRADDLFNFARSIGVAVTPASTLSTVADGLEARTGMSLARWRDAHLAARYGTGPVPEAWPYAQMKTAAAARKVRKPELVEA